MKRYIDGAIQKFVINLLGVTVGLFAVIAIWVGITNKEVQFPYLNVAFVASWVVAVAMLVPVLWLMRTRPADKVATWGESMIGATYTFFILFWIYGTVPHQWLTFADSELNWRSDAFMIGPRVPWGDQQGILEWALPFDMTYAVLKDIIAVKIYGIALVCNVAIVSMWQKRGDMIKVDESEAGSRYGRPLIKASEEVSA